MNKGFAALEPIAEEQEQLQPPAVVFEPERVAVQKSMVTAIGSGAVASTGIRGARKGGSYFRAIADEIRDEMDANREEDWAIVSREMPDQPAHRAGTRKNSFNRGTHQGVAGPGHHGRDTFMDGGASAMSWSPMHAANVPKDMKEKLYLSLKGGDGDKEMGNDEEDGHGTVPANLAGGSKGSKDSVDGDTGPSGR